MKVKLSNTAGYTGSLKLKVVKAVKFGTNLSLKAAKDYVDSNLSIIDRSDNGIEIQEGILVLVFEDTENQKIIDLLKKTFSVVPLPNSDKEAEVANVEEQFGVKIQINDKYELVIAITIGFDKSIAQQMLNSINAICSDKVFISREKRNAEGCTIVDIIIDLDDEEADLDKINEICQKFMDMLHSTFLRMQLENVLGISNECANDTTKKLKGLLE